MRAPTRLIKKSSVITVIEAEGHPDGAARARRDQDESKFLNGIAGFGSGALHRGMGSRIQVSQIKRVPRPHGDGAHFTVVGYVVTACREMTWILSHGFRCSDKAGQLPDHRVGRVDQGQLPCGHFAATRAGLSFV
jgi:hypothetical protein